MSKQRNWGRILFWGIVAGSILVRGALIVQAGGCRQDPDNYLPIAKALANGDGFVFNGRPTAYRPPLYPLLLASLMTFGSSSLPWTVGLLHIGLGVLTVILVSAFMKDAGCGEPSRLAAAFVVAFDPVLVVQSRGVMTETFAACLVALTLWAASPRGKGAAIRGGFAAGLSILCRPSLLPGALALVMARGFAERGGRRKRYVESALYLLVLMSTLLPWAIRNRIELGEVIWTTTHGGYTLALANNPVYFAEVLDGPPGAVWSGENQARWWRRITNATLTLSEPSADRAILEGTLTFMSEHPEQTVRASLARLGRFWSFAPSGAVYPLWLRLITAAWTLPLYLLVIDGLIRRWPIRWPCLGVLSVILALTCVHAFFWTDLRMRAPIVPALAILAAGSRLFNRGRSTLESDGQIKKR